MEIIRFNENIKNGNLLFFLVGALAFPALHSFTDLIDQVVLLLFKPDFNGRFIFALTLEVFICTVLGWLLLVLVRNRKNTMMILNVTKLKTLGILVIVVMLINKATKYFFLKGIINEIQPDGDISGNLYMMAYLQFAIGSVSLVKDILLFAMLFIIIAQNKKDHFAAN